MKFWQVALLGAVLSGCATQKSAGYRGTPADRCSMVAQQRMQDGALIGYEEGLQKAIYRDTYADCVKWDAAHAIN